MKGAWGSHRLLRLYRIHTFFKRPLPQAPIASLSERKEYMPSPPQFESWPSALPVSWGPYRGVVQRVVDGDTLYALIDVGFSTYVYHSIRVYGIDSPELYTSDPIEKEKGRAARAYLESICPPTTKCTLRTDKDRTTFGRYIASILLADGRDVASEMVASGHAAWSEG